MRWTEKGKLNIKAADLALLSNPTFRGKAWANVSSWVRTENNYPPIPSAVFFALLSNPKETNPKMLWMRYRSLLEVSNNPEKYYHQHTITVHGKTRQISQPMYPLEAYQRWILKNILEKTPTTEYTYAYKKGTSLIDNARVHLGNQVLVKLDISHFFDSITFGMVYDVFANQMRFPTEGATLLTNLCCLNGRLPQGACTSPYLSNLCVIKADNEIAEYCKEHNLSYSRYSDDMTFSGNRIAVKDLISFVQQTLKKYGFRLNYKKIHVDGKGRQHRVTGIVCNEKISTPVDYRKQVRQEIYYLKKFGVVDHLIHMNNSEFMDDNGTPNADSYFSSLLGRIAYVLQVTPDNEEFVKYREYVNGCMDKEEKRKALLKRIELGLW